MGGSVSAGKSNDDLIDNLLAEGYIKSPLIEKVFRTVDRAFYFLSEGKHTAYRDMAWKQGNLHLSAPCIYTKVLEDLKIEPGHSFLNIGSGTGYLSTMVGMILGPYGLNHGIEIQSDVVDYSYEKLDEFKRNSNAVDIFEFCEPHFVVGNGLHLSPGQTYDRIYCGASCPQEHHKYIKKYLKIGGILIMPCDENLLKFTRTSETDWARDVILSVSFSTLQSLKRKNIDMISMPDSQPLCLQELCRSKIRCILRDVVEKESPELKAPRKKKSRRADHRRRDRDPFTVSVFDATDMSDLNPIHQGATGAIFRNFIRTFRGGVENDEQLPDIIDDSDDDSSSTSSSTSSSSEADPGQVTNNSTLGVVDDATHSTNPRTTSSDAKLDVKTSEMVSKSQNMKNRASFDATGQDMLPVKLGPDVEVDKKRAYLETKSDDDHEESNQNVRKQVDEENEEASSNQPKKLLKREKLDSGISEESDDGKISVSTEEESSCSELSSSFSEPMELESDDSESMNRLFTDGDEQPNADTNNECGLSYDTVMLNYRTMLEKKIHTLPLPQRIKFYLNYDRDFKCET